MPVNLQVNPVFNDIKITPGDQRRFVFLCGYIGQVSIDSIDLYPGLDLRCYYQIPIDAIKAVDKEDPLHEISPSRLVVDASRQITIVYNRTRSVEAGFLAGAIASGECANQATCTCNDVEAEPVHRGATISRNSTGTHSSPACTTSSGKCNCLVASLERE